MKRGRDKRWSERRQTEREEKDRGSKRCQSFEILQNISSKPVFCEDKVYFKVKFYFVPKNLTW